MPEQELLRMEGVVQSVVFVNEENGYTVFELSAGGELFVVCGVVGEIHIGETVMCTGRFEMHSTYGKQFKALTCETDIPREEQAIFAYLSSGSLPYIGVATAKKIMEKFGEKSLEIIATEPMQLVGIRGLSPDKIKRIHEEFHRMFGVRELIAYLSRFDISAARAVQVFKSFGGAAIDAINKNPYLLCGEPLHLGFRHADSIAAELQFSQDGDLRCVAALLYTLRHNANNGHTCLPCEKLLQTTSRFVNVETAILSEVLEKYVAEGEIDVKSFDGIDYAYLPDLLIAEQDIAHRLAELLTYPKPTVFGIDRDIQFLELTQGFSYAQNQRKAIEGALTENCFVLTGGPGTGKTTTLNAVLKLLEQQGKRVSLCAPTGRAAKRLSELTGHKASTIHRLLEAVYTNGVMTFQCNETNLLKCEVVVLDEMSMVDAKLFQALLSALKRGCRIIMVGDADQLPSVGAGNVLGDVLKVDAIPSVCLNEIFRQAEQSLIVKNAHNIVEGKTLEKGEKTDDFFFIEAIGQTCQELICDIASRRLPQSYGFDAVRDIQVLCPTKLGPSGTTALNAQLQMLLNPPRAQKAEITVGSITFRQGDKVMQVRNNYDIPWHKAGSESGVGAYNGDIGVILAIDVKDRSMTVQMDDRTLIYSAEHLIELEIAYAITIHKSQGSEFPAVILPVAEVPEKLRYRNLIYTGVTRARKLCVMIGQRSTAQAMIANVKQNMRFSGLYHILSAEPAVVRRTV